jgi:integrase
MFNLAVEWNATNKVWRSDNPALGVKKYPEEKRSRWLDKKEIGSLLKVLDKYPEQKTANAIRLILLTGSRKGEALAAKWPDIDLKNRLWRKDSAHTKQKREEFVPLNSDAVKLLKRMRKTAKDGDEFLFPGRIADRPLEDLKIHWAEIRKQAGLPNVWSRGVTRWFRFCLSVADSFVCRCLTSGTMLPSSHPAHRTGRADLPHPALGEDSRNGYSYCM